MAKIDYPFKRTDVVDWVVDEGQLFVATKDGKAFWHDGEVWHEGIYTPEGEQMHCPSCSAAIEKRS